MKTITKFLFALLILLTGASNVQAELYVFGNVEDNRWHNLNNWLTSDESDENLVPTHLPTIDDEVYICDDVVIDGTAEAGELCFAPSHNQGVWNTVDIRITKNGGLTIGTGGFAHIGQNNGKDDLISLFKGNSITIENTSAEDFEANNGAGYLRIHPAVTYMPEGIVVVEYKTAAGPGNYTNSGENRDRTWQYVGAPGMNTVLNLDSRTWLYRWSESYGWNKAEDGMWPFEGYAITQTNVPSYTWYTTPINENQFLYLPCDNEGINIFANSYLAPINVSAFTEGDFSKNIEPTFYLFNTGSFNDWVEAANQPSTDYKQSPGQYTAIPVFAAENMNSEEDPMLIAPMQGVYVVANEISHTGQSSGISLDYSRLVWDTKFDENVTGNVAMRAPQQSTLLRRIRIQAFGEKSGSDRMYIMEDKNCTPGYDNGYDAKNMIADGQVSIYTSEACGKMEVSSTNDMNGMYIGFQASVDTVYTLRFSSLIGEALYIKDLANGNIIELKDDATYTFHAKAYSVNNMRFQVLVDPFITDEGNGNNTTTDVDNIQSSNTFWMSDSHICVSTNQANSVATIYNVSGQMIMNVPFNNQIEIPTHNFSTGVYILQTNNERYKFIID